MRRLVFSACLLLAGIVAGWWLRDLAGERLSLPADEATGSSGIPFAVPVPSGQPAATGTDDGTPAQRRDTEALPDLAGFNALLEQGDFEQSIAYYDSALQMDESFQALLKPGLEDYLRERARDCSNGDFIDLVNLWLDAYYADIEVLLLLAEHQRLCSSSEEAARTLQIARTYAILPGQRESVAAAVATLIAATEARLSRQQEWVTLLGFYEFLDVIDLETGTSQLRRASLYEQFGEVQRGRDLLVSLRENDNGLDAAWTAALNQQLAESAPQPVADAAPLFEIALTRHGNHYLVPAILNDDSPLTLMIDTGASVTALSRESFERMERRGVRYLGTRLFNTPNGITQGDLYRADSLQLGDARVSDLEIAVLEYDAGNGLDGLLGMNVLRNFRFEIDQDREVLNMNPRR